MKLFLNLSLMVFLVGSVASAATQVKCDTGEVQRQSPMDDAATSSPLKVTVPAEVPYTQDLQSHNKTYIFLIPDNSFPDITFSTADGTIKFLYTASVAQWGLASELDASAPNGVTVTSGSDTDLSAKVSLTVGLKSAFVYCVQVK